ncbi:hypothetical protein DdX_10677 [Ditylenchus destructor]|uniref:Uncharacterized protein n=1 Tax=Ditylenchus destructor TaxID=166010 RepID=A0AAD4R5F5_9BILA|nr:hypothetical protein DdX_10677 [Ditylenchus destructor]
MQGSLPMSSLKSMTLLASLFGIFFTFNFAVANAINQLGTIDEVKVETILDYISAVITFNDKTHEITINPEAMSSKPDYSIATIRVKKAVLEYLRKVVKEHIGTENSLRSLSGEKAFLAVNGILWQSHSLVRFNQNWGKRDGHPVRDWPNKEAKWPEYQRTIKDLHELTEHVNLTRLLFEISNSQKWEANKNMTPENLQDKLCLLSSLKADLITQKGGKIILHPEKLSDDVASGNVLIQGNFKEDLLVPFETYFVEGWANYHYIPEVKDQMQQGWNKRFVESLDSLYKECEEKVEKSIEKSGKQKKEKLRSCSRSCSISGGFATCVKWIAAGLKNAGEALEETSKKL